MLRWAPFTKRKCKCSGPSLLYHIPNTNTNQTKAISPYLKPWHTNYHAHHIANKTAVGFEVVHLDDAVERAWLTRRIAKLFSGTGGGVCLSPAERVNAGALMLQVCRRVECCIEWNGGSMNEWDGVCGAVTLYFGAETLRPLTIILHTHFYDGNDDQPTNQQNRPRRLSTSSHASSRASRCGLYYTWLIDRRDFHPFFFFNRPLPRTDPYQNDAILVLSPMTDAYITDTHI